jgi:hypothetical protein
MYGKLWLVICVRNVKRKGCNGQIQSVNVGWAYGVIAVVILRCFVIVVLIFAAILFLWITPANYVPQRTKL